MLRHAIILLLGFVLWLCPHTVLSYSAETYLNKTVSLRYRKTPLRQVLTDLSKQTQVSFVYQDSLVDPVAVSCRFRNRTLESILPDIIQRDKLDYRIIDDCLIVLLPAKKMDPPKPIERKIFKPKDYNIQNPHFKAPRVISEKKPDYPRIAINRKISGRVSLNMLVNEGGTVDTVYVRKSSGYVLLDSAAIRHALQSQCAPARLGNRAISMWMKWDFDFQFKDYYTQGRIFSKESEGKK